MTMEFSGRRILVTGGASGIGQATAALLASQGAKVAVLDRDEKIHVVARALDCLGVVADVRDEQGVEQAVAQAARQLGGIDGLVNSAGIALMKPIERLSLDEWQAILAINLTGTFLVCRAVLPWLRQAAGATIVNVGSAQAFVPSPNATAYAASKAGVVLFSKSLAAELAPAIRVNCVCPGLVDTPMHREVHANDDAQTTQRLLARIPLGRKAEPIEVARMIAFLTSPASSYITCSAMSVDGGRCFH